MDIDLNITIHIFSSNQLRDEILAADSNECGLYAPEDIIPLRKYHHHNMSVSYDNKTTISEIIKLIIHDIECDNNNELNEGKIYFCNEKERYAIDNGNANFEFLRLNYFNSNPINIQILLSMDAGQVFSDAGLRFYMYSHESGQHHQPHVHVTDIKYGDTATIALWDGRILAGHLRKGRLSQVKSIISSKSSILYDYWKAHTDGLIPDINHGFGYLGY